MEQAEKFATHSIEMSIVDANHYALKAVKLW